MPQPTTPILTLDQLSVRFTTSERVVDAVSGLSFSIAPGETLAVVGESGSGKSVTALAIMRLIEQGGGTIHGGSMQFQRPGGAMLDLRHASHATMRQIRGAEIAVIFQEPMTSLNPVFTIGEQIAESIRLHQGKSFAAAQAEALRMLDRVRIPNAAQVLTRHPHQLSGGMRQRVMIAMALSCQPALLIADEPTTALDVTTQAQILQLIRELQQDSAAMAVLFITHDMGVVADVADRVVVMCRGEQVETASTAAIFNQPQHPYTQALLAAVPRLGAMRGSDNPAPFPLPGQPMAGSSTSTSASTSTSTSAPHYDGPALLKARQICTRFDIKSGLLGRVKQRVHAVEGVSFDLYPGETLALVGESGCGKSTTGRAILRLVDLQAGSVEIDGRDLAQLSKTELRAMRRQIQFIFQDPFASLDPRLTVGYSIMEPLLIHGLAEGAQERVKQLLLRVGLLPEHAQRYPHEFSGGQRQRICIARALALKPKIIIADESVSALDVSIQAQIINLLLELQQELGLAMIFISHDMAVVERVAHRVAVMYLGQIVEIGPRRAIFENPQHPYTQKLMAAIPVADPGRRPLTRTQRGPFNNDELPSPIRAVGDEPQRVVLHEVSQGHFVAQ